MPFEGRPVYRRSAYSLDLELESLEQSKGLIFDSGMTSIKVGRLQIEVTVHDGKAVHVWGLHSAMNWRTHPLPPFDSRPGAVFVVNVVDFLSGVSIGLAEVGEWVTAYDQSIG